MTSTHPMEEGRSVKGGGNLCGADALLRMGFVVNLICRFQVDLLEGSGRWSETVRTP